MENISSNGPHHNLEKSLHCCIFGFKFYNKKRFVLNRHTVVEIQAKDEKANVCWRL